MRACVRARACVGKDGRPHKKIKKMENLRDEVARQDYEDVLDVLEAY